VIWGLHHQRIRSALMAKKILTGKVTQIQLGAISIEGLLLEDGTFAIAQQQVATLFSVLPTSIPKMLRRLLGGSFQLFQVKTNRNDGTPRQNRSESAMNLIQFEKVLRKLDRKGNKTAQEITDGLVGLSFNQVWSDAFGVQFNAESRRAYLKSRILDAPNPWVRMYDPRFCRRVFSWFGAHFYWLWVYDFLSPEEQAKHNRLNPVVNGKRDCRIHQYLDDSTKDRIKEHIRALVVLVDTSTSRQDFLTRVSRLDGVDQLDLGV